MIAPTDAKGQPVIPVHLAVRDVSWGRLGFLSLPSVGDMVSVWHQLDLVPLIITGIRHSPAMLSEGHDPGEVPSAAQIHMTAERA